MGAARAVFAIAALFNFFIAAALLLAPTGFLDALGIEATVDTLLIARMFGIPVASFGVGYLFVAARPPPIATSSGSASSASRRCSSSR